MVETYAHSFFTWALSKHGVRAGRAAAVAGAVGAALPDLPSVVATAYYVGPTFLREGWSSMHSEGVLDAIYFTGPFGAVGSALHSAVPVALLLVLYRALGLGGLDARRVVLWFLLGWLGHAVADFFTHAGDTRPLFWPLSDWRWSSPVSYWNPSYYGRQFFFVEHALMLAILAWLAARMVFRGKSGRAPSQDPR